MRFTLAFSLAASLALASHAAAEEPVVAKLRAPLASAAKPVAGGAVFECLGNVCAARAPAADSGAVRGCKDLARQVGAVESFGSNSKPLSAEEIASCNKSARN
jgi:hypothetical protein